MPRGRPVDYDKRIAALLDELRTLIVAKEQAEMQARVSARLSAVLRTLDAGRPSAVAQEVNSADVTTRKKRGPGKGNPKLKAKLKSYWANMSPADRKARIAKMQAGRKK